MYEQRIPGSTPSRPSRPAPQWQDSDLDDIMALLDKDYTKPQPRAQHVPQPQAQYVPQPRAQYVPQTDTRYAPQPKAQPVQPVNRAADPEMDEIMALLAKDYTKPQPEQPRARTVSQPRAQYVPQANTPYAPQPKAQPVQPVNRAADPEMDEIMALLARDYTKPQPGTTAAVQAEMPRLAEPEKAGKKAAKKPAKAQKATKAEREPQEKQPMKPLELALTALAGVESAALVGLVIWCVLWLR